MSTWHAGRASMRTARSVPDRVVAPPVRVVAAARPAVDRHGLALLVIGLVGALLALALPLAPLVTTVALVVASVVAAVGWELTTGRLDGR